MSTSTYRHVPVERQEPPAPVVIQQALVQNRPIPTFDHPTPMLVRPPPVQARSPLMQPPPAPTQTAPILIQHQPTLTQSRPAPPEPQPAPMANPPITRTSQISAMGRVCGTAIPTSSERVIHENESHMSSRESFLCTLCMGKGDQNRFAGRGASFAHMRLFHGFATGHWIDQQPSSEQ